MSGGTGNDTYIVDSTGDSVTENLNEGTDTVLSSIDYILGINLENLVLQGTAINGTGNELANSITGNEGNNSLNGALGNDILFGNGGADTMLGAGGLDTLDGGEGDDNLNGGLAADSLVGGGGNDILIGADGNDILVGGTGNDTITGGVGSDTIRYTSGDGADRINVFTTGVGGDFLSFSGVANIDVRSVTNATTGVTNTFFRVGDGIAGNAGFNTGELLLTLAGTGFTQADIATNITDSAGTTFLFS
ncbi:MAG TPA: hypothetical protein DCZ55_09790 [Cyanobacteria bacterium UBA11371]|nr:hypothetical protein [Cyanobacteria bacterium UBA11371]